MSRKQLIRTALLIILAGGCSGQAGNINRPVTPVTPNHASAHAVELESAEVREPAEVRAIRDCRPLGPRDWPRWPVGCLLENIRSNCEDQNPNPEQMEECAGEAIERVMSQTQDRQITVTISRYPQEIFTNITEPSDADIGSNLFGISSFNREDPDVVDRVTLQSSERDDSGIVFYVSSWRVKASSANGHSLDEDHFLRFNFDGTTEGDLSVLERRLGISYFRIELEGDTITAHFTAPNPLE